MNVWRTEDGECIHKMTGHTSRVWDVSANSSARHVTSASGDGTIKVWDIWRGTCLNTLRGHEGDVYSVQYHPDQVRKRLPTTPSLERLIDRSIDQCHVGSGGYDKTVRLFDTRTGTLLKVRAIRHMCGRLANSTERRRVSLLDLPDIHWTYIGSIQGHFQSVWQLVDQRVGGLSERGMRKRVFVMMIVALSCRSKDSTVKFWDITRYASS